MALSVWIYGAYVKYFAVEIENGAYTLVAYAKIKCIAISYVTLPTIISNDIN